MNEAALLLDDDDLKKEFCRNKAWLIAFLIVLGLHAGALAIVELYSPTVTPLPSPPMAMSVELFPISAAPVAPEDAESQKRPPLSGLKPESEPEPETPPPSLKAEVFISKPPPPRKMERPPEKPRDIAKPLPESPPAASRAAAIAPNAASAPASPGQQATESARVAEVRQSWVGQVMAYLERHRKYPGQAQSLRQEGTVLLRFSIDRTGHVSNARLEKTSAFRILDDEGLAMLERAGRLPPPPLEIKGDMIELVVPVRFSLRR